MLHLLWLLLSALHCCQHLLWLLHAAVKPPRAPHSTTPPEHQQTHAGLPKGVVKRIMLCDADVQRVSADAVWLVGEATRLFLHALAAKGAAVAAAKKRKTVQLPDLEQLIRCGCRR